MAEICVAHLVRESNGVAPFSAFLDSYRRHAPGVGHELLIIFKGFRGEVVPEAYRALLGELPHRSFFVADEGFDILPYLNAARAFDHRLFCFLNSFSVILDDGWLAKLYEHGQRAGVGLVGATGSHESMYTNYLRRWRRDDDAGGGGPRRGGSAAWVRNLRDALHYRRHYAPFPNYHLRSNAFLIARALASGLRIGRLVEKADAYRFESGREGLTRQVMKMGLRPLVVGRDGRAYEKEDWYESATFRSGEQRNLLVADNQTRLYAESDAATRRALALAAWGRR